jgi:hypothetical protein
MKKNTPTKADLLYAMRAIDLVLTRNRHEPAHITLGRIDYWVNRALRDGEISPKPISTQETHMMTLAQQEKRELEIDAAILDFYNSDNTRRKIIKVR